MILTKKKKLRMFQLKKNANDRSIDYNIDSRRKDIIFSGDIGRYRILCKSTVFDQIGIRNLVHILYYL